jgi:hypothetical protein
MEPAMPEGYGLKAEPEPAFHSPAPAETPAFSPALPEPAFSLSTPSPVPSPPAPSLAPSTAPAVRSTQPPSAPPPAASYAHALTIWFSERVLQWVPPVAVVLIFVLQLFPWVGVYPGGVPAFTQNAWQAAFGGGTPDPDMAGIYPGTREKEKDTKKSSEGRSDKKSSKDDNPEPGASLLTLLYLLPFYLVTLFVTLFVAVLPFVKVQLPPQVHQLLPWRWAIVTGLNAILLLFLGLQAVLSFDLESKAREWVRNQPIAQEDPRSLKTPEVKQRQAFIGERDGWIQRTWALYFVVLLHILATVSAAIVYGNEKRGLAKPLPKLELLW